MCTVSWVHQPDGYHLLCNRDEKRTRSIAFAPRVVICRGVRYIAPIDADGGGTWLTVNEFGVSLCLLNGSPASRSSAVRRSRGLLVRELASARSAGDCSFWLRQLDLTSFAAFSVVILEPGRAAVLAHWAGGELTIDPAGDGHMPLTSSSYDSAGVRRSRLNELARRVAEAHSFDPAVLYRFHASHGAAPDAYSTCMHRDDAETVSFSWVAVSGDSIRFLYSPGALCQSKLSAQQILVRAA
jgi:uncharacterized protein with NRDE domain